MFELVGFLKKLRIKISNKKMQAQNFKTINMILKKYYKIEVYEHFKKISQESHHLLYFSWSRRMTHFDNSHKYFSGIRNLSFDLIGFGKIDQN